MDLQIRNPQITRRSRVCTWALLASVSCHLSGALSILQFWMGLGAGLPGLGPSVTASHGAHAAASLPQAHMNLGKAMMEHQGLDFSSVLLGLRAACPKICHNGLLIILN